MSGAARPPRPSRHIRSRPRGHRLTHADVDPGRADANRRLRMTTPASVRRTCRVDAPRAAPAVRTCALVAPAARTCDLAAALARTGAARSGRTAIDHR